MYPRNSLRNPLEQIPNNEFQIPVLFLANIYLTPMDFVGAVLLFLKDRDSDISFHLGRHWLPACYILVQGLK